MRRTIRDYEKQCVKLFKAIQTANAENIRLVAKVDELERFRRDDAEMHERVVKEKNGLATRVAVLEAYVTAEKLRVTSAKQQLHEEFDRRVALRLLFDARDAALWDVRKMGAETDRERVIQASVLLGLKGCLEDLGAV
jgi:hypothetical protein